MSERTQAILLYGGMALYFVVAILIVLEGMASGYGSFW